MNAEGHPRQCQATRRDGVRCTKWANAGTTVCRMHGGSAPQVKKKAAQRIAEEKAARMIGGDVDPVTDPIGELRLLMGRAKALENALWESMGESRDPSVADAYADALDRVSKLLTDFTRLGLEERYVELQETQAQVITGIFTTVLAQLHGMLREGWELERVFVEEAPRIIRGELLRAGGSE